MSTYTPRKLPFPSMAPIRPGESGFYQRTELFNRIQDQLQAGDSVSLVGERKAGKTSFLNYLQTNLAADQFIPVYIDSQTILPQLDALFLGTLIQEAGRAIAAANRQGNDTEGMEGETAVSPPSSPTASPASQLLWLLDGRFDEEELQTITFHLGIDYDNLPALGKVNKARELIKHLQQRQRLSSLVQVGKQLRDDIEWPTIASSSPIPTSEAPFQTQIFAAPPHELYRLFDSELEQLRHLLPHNKQGQKQRLVWLIDEIETLRSYEQTNLFTRLRPLAQSDPHFRFVIAGYDVLYTLATVSEWSPFFNAFHAIRLEGLNPVAAQQLLADASETMSITLNQAHYQNILSWAGRKPFFSKWFMNKIAEALNQRATNLALNESLLAQTKTNFLTEPNITQVFDHQWKSHTTERQQTVLALIATHIPPFSYPQILNWLKTERLLDGDRFASQHLVEDMTRLKQLGFLYETAGEYRWTSQCLQTWIQANKPL